MAQCQECGERRQQNTHGLREVALLHSLQRLGDSVTDLDAALLELLGCCAQPRVLFDARRQLDGASEDMDGPSPWHGTHASTLVRRCRTLHSFRVLKLVDIALELLDAVLQFPVLLYFFAEDVDEGLKGGLGELVPPTR
jgi:hypothetical protein